MVCPPPNPVTTADDDDDEDDDEEEDFRTDGRVFDACLLGYCDDVTRNLVKELNNHHHHHPSTTTTTKTTSPISSQTSSHSNSSRSTGTDTSSSGGGGGRGRHTPSEEGTLLSLSLKSESESCSLPTNKTTQMQMQMPHNRVFLFPGAMLQTNGALQKKEEDMYTHTEVAHCDGCQEEIVGPILHKCSQCFDFDLCQTCYPSVSVQHYHGKHTFITESRTKPTTKNE
eukprot:scaffold6251_cov52-Attheya_sp.AAC.2